jgi:hypothetical protein
MPRPNWYRRSTQEGAGHLRMAAYDWIKIPAAVGVLLLLRAYVGVERKWQYPCGG